MKELKVIVKKCIEAIEKNKTDVFQERYDRIINLLSTMDKAIEEGRYPKDYIAIPLLNYVERNMDQDEIYQVLQELNTWYLNNYREKDKATIMRAANIQYLTSECKMSEKRAVDTIRKMAKHKDIYIEFSQFVEKYCFPENQISECGYTAQKLNEETYLSIIGAYNYLIYLREEPQEALADLKKGLPKR